MSTQVKYAIAALVLVALLALPMLGSLYAVYLVTEIIIFALFALSFNLLLGFGGMISFGHAAYFAIGAYACAIFLTTLQLPLIVALPGAVFVSAFVAGVIGYVCTRLTEIYFAMLTLAFGQLVWAVAFKWAAVTGGDTGFIGVHIPEFLDNPTSFFYFALAVVVISGLIMWRIVNSAYGFTLSATRENRNRAEFIGVNVRRVQWVAFVLAGTFAGVAGALFTMFNHAVFVESAWWTQSAEVMIMSILGGVGSFIGPAVGAAVLILLDRFITEFTVYWPTVLAAILLAILFYFPEGLTGFLGKRAGQSSGKKE